MSAESSQLDGLLYKSPTEAFDASKKILKTNNKVLFADIDDNIFHSEPWIRSKLNDIISGFDNSFVPVTIDEVKATPSGRYYQVPRYQEAASKMGVKFLELFLKVQNDIELHAAMMPTPDRLEVVEEFLRSGFVLGGYPTARPSSLSQVTASALNYFGFPKGPVIDVNADSGKPANAKVDFFRNVLEGNQANKKIVFMDDDIDTVIAVKKALPDIVCIVTQVQRNDTRIDAVVLDQLGIIHGSPREIKSLISRL